MPERADDDIAIMQHAQTPVHVFELVVNALLPAHPPDHDRARTRFDFLGQRHLPAEPQIARHGSDLVEMRANHGSSFRAVIASICGTPKIFA